MKTHLSECDFMSDVCSRLLNTRKNIPTEAVVVRWNKFFSEKTYKSWKTMMSISNLFLPYPLLQIAWLWIGFRLGYIVCLEVLLLSAVLLEWHWKVWLVHVK